MRSCTINEIKRNLIMLLATQPLSTLDRRNVNLQVGGGKEEYQFPAARPVVGTDCGCTSVHKASLRLQNLTNQVEKRISLQTISFWVERVIMFKLSSQGNMLCGSPGEMEPLRNMR